MRMFLIAVVVVLVTGVGAAALLNAVQRPAEVAFATQGARIDHVE